MSLLGDIASSIKEAITGNTTIEGVRVEIVGEPPSPCDRGGTAVAILPGTAERDEPLVNNRHDQWDAAIAVEVVMGDPGDGPLDEVYARIDDWEPADSLCVVAAQVAEVQQMGARHRAGGEPPGATISPDHAGSQVQDGSGAADGQLGVMPGLPYRGAEPP